MPLMDSYFSEPKWGPMALLGWPDDFETFSCTFFFVNLSSTVLFLKPDVFFLFVSQTFLLDALAGRDCDVFFKMFVFHASLPLPC